MGWSQFWHCLKLIITSNFMEPKYFWSFFNRMVMINYLKGRLGSQLKYIPKNLIMHLLDLNTRLVLYFMVNFSQIEVNIDCLFFMDTFIYNVLWEYFVKIIDINLQLVIYIDLTHTHTHTYTHFSALLTYNYISEYFYL
jgi:hypothetical protein